ncbi:oligopeptidase B [Thermaurantimonas aggregans]|uniref:Proline-specific endopeptidase n=1 Tax=Thermaurantimonas aggregans TaxID=2173829 RepID=A0A401XMB4_9FLAO|nr:S9 family peptidase [Thermaurantimonas aggregans]MCX8147753.1 S9 family peptidase [Thermaurantimonas aggregans]GCD78157.1 oligopeptidase B [Thermaurantimonas aggregans]
MTAPIAEKIPKILEIHGDRRIDYYYWLNERENPKVIEYLKAENAYTEAIFSELKPLKDKILQELKSRIKEDDSSVPYESNGYFYYYRYEAGKEYPLYCRKRGNLQAEEEIMLDQNKLAEGKKFHSIGGLAVSFDNQLLAYSEDTIGRRQYVIRFKNLKTGEVLPQSIPNTTGQAVWAADNKTVFFNIKDDALRSFKVMRFNLETQAIDEVFHEKDEKFSCYVYPSASKRFILIGSSSTLTSEIRYVPADQPYDAFKIFQLRETGVRYAVADVGDRWIIKTNTDQAENFKLMTTLLNRTARANWKDLISHRTDVLIEDFIPFKSHLVVEEKYGGQIHLSIYDYSGRKLNEVSMPEPTYALNLGINENQQSEWVRFEYQSFVTPPSTREYNLRTGETRVLKTKEVPGYDFEQYESRYIYAKAADGEEVPISIVYRKSTELDGTAPCVLYGYGSYGYSLEATFSTSRISLLDRGFVYAIAHVRGGQEKGRRWYEEGKFLKKKNTFTDFIACAEHLIAEKYADPKRLFAWGGSAGGLLMGAVVNMRPELWAGVVSEVPFVDVVTTMLDESLPLTVGEFEEWGNPKDPEYYYYMKSYSPYDNIDKKVYPPMLVTTGLHDSQVQYWEPAKYVAKLRATKTDNNPLLLYTNMDAGHGGASGRYSFLEEVAMKYVFLLDMAQLAVKEL